MKKNTKENIINKFIEVHGDKYDYSKVEYVNYHKKVCVICPEHGDFFITPANHINGRGCKLCKIEKLKKTISHTTIFFINESKKIHRDKYDYSKVEYKNAITKVCIICPKHR